MIQLVVKRIFLYLQVMSWFGMEITLLKTIFFLFSELTKDKWDVIALACKRQDGNKAVGFRVLYCFLSSILALQNLGMFLH